MLDPGMNNEIGYRGRIISTEDIEFIRGLIADNPQFLISPWVKVPNSAGHLLSRMARILSEQWEGLYNHPIRLLETFIDPTRFRGTCCRAANWIYPGLTTGRGKDDQTNKPNRSLKELWAYPLGRDFREQLCRGDE